MKYQPWEKLNLLENGFSQLIQKNISTITSS